MKGKDLAVLGAIGLALYMLIPKGKEAAAAGGITAIIPLPGAAPGAGPLDIGGIFGGMGEMFAGLLGAIPEPIVPEINIPEFILPPIVMPEWPGAFEFDWSQYFPDWESFLPSLPDELKLPGIPGLIPGIPGLPDLIPDLIPDIFKGDGDGDGAMVTAIGSGVNLWDKGWNFIDAVLRGKLLAVGEENALAILFPGLTPEDPDKIPEAYVRESEAIFEAAGVSEATPGNIDLLIAAREKITGVQAEDLPAIGTEAYMLRMLGGVW